MYRLCHVAQLKKEARPLETHSCRQEENLQILIRVSVKHTECTGSQSGIHLCRRLKAMPDHSA